MIAGGGVDGCGSVTIEAEDNTDRLEEGSNNRHAEEDGGGDGGDREGGGGDVAGHGGGGGNEDSDGDGKCERLEGGAVGITTGNGFNDRMGFRGGDLAGVGMMIRGCAWG